MKTLLITGGSDGLGKALAESTSKDYNVIILARNEEKLKAIASEINCTYYVCDVKDQKAIAKTIETIIKEHGHIDILLNNAGVIVNGPLPDTSDKDIENVITTNTLGSIYMAKEVLTHMRKQKSGLILNVVSQSGLTARANRSIYNTSKWGLTGFTKALQEEAAEYGVRVTGFYPGTIYTDLFAKAGIDMKGTAITTDQAVKAIKFVIEMDDDVLIPELGIKHLG